MLGEAAWFCYSVDFHFELQGVNRYWVLSLQAFLNALIGIHFDLRRHPSFQHVCLGLSQEAFGQYRGLGRSCIQIAGFQTQE